MEKIVSIAAGMASAHFTHLAGHPAHFDARVWIGAGTEDVVDYFSWRQADAGRNALSSWCYWTLRGGGATAREATAALHAAGASALNELLFARGVNFADVPAWQKRGIGLWRTNGEPRSGVNPITGVSEAGASHVVHVERELPLGEEYRQFVSRILSEDAERLARASVA